MIAPKSRKKKPKKVKIVKGKAKVAIQPPQKFNTGVFEVVIINSNYWYNDLEGSIFKALQSADKTFYKTINPIYRRCEFGKILACDCQIINKKIK